MSLPQPLEYVIKRCLAPQPSDRFTTAEDLLSSFEYAYQYLKSAPQKPAAPLSIPPVPPVPVAGNPAIPVIPNRMSTPRPIRNTNPQIKSLPRSEDMPPLPLAVPIQRPNAFGREDYESPTVDIDMSQLSTQRKPVTAPSLPAAPPTRPKKRRRNPIPVIITLLIVFILLAMAGIFLFEFQPVLAATANVNFGPQVQVVKQVFHLKGSSSQSNINVNTSTIPVKVLNSSKSGTLSGQTSQQCLIPPIIDCQQVVSQDDVDHLSAQLRQSLDKQIQQDLQQQVQNKGGTQVGSIRPTDAPVTSTPPVGTQSKTVTVNINNQQGQGAYYSNQDAKTLALLLLKQQAQQLGTNYALLNASIQIGQPAYEGIDPSGQVLIIIAAAGVAQYHFPISQLNAIQSSLRGMKLVNANTFVKQQPGVDPASVSIHISSGTIMPSDSSKIKMITVNPTTLPTITLPQVTPMPTSTTIGNTWVASVASLMSAQ